MIRIELHTLIGKLNQQTKLALEQAGALSIERQNPEVTVEHLLFTLLDNPLCDVRVLLKSAEVDHTHIRQLTGDALSREIVPENTPSFSPLLVELLQDAWLLGSTDLGHSEIRSGVIFLAALIRPDRYLPLNLIRQLESVNRETMKKHFTRLTEDSAETAVKVDSAKGKQAVPAEAETALARFCTNFSAMAKQGELDPVLCRDDEINLMIDILCRRRKNNPIVVGDAGVGKSAVVEGLAQRIVDGNVPDSLKGIDLMSLDLGLLQAGASVKGEFEKRLKAIIDEVKTSPVPIILFIDEAHTMIGAGAQEGGGDAANLLKPALARGELRTVAATTWKEYKKYFEKDPALSRRFQLVKLDEPNVEQAVDIMRGLHGVYEKSHQVLISDDALVAAAELSERYVSGRQLPDKAIDVLDTACARIAINQSSPPRRLAELETRTIQRQRQIDMLNRQAELGYDVDEALLASLEADEAKDLEEQGALREAWRVQKDLVADVIEKRQQILTVPSEDEEPLSDEDREAIRNELRGFYAELDAIPHTERLVHPHVDAQQIAEVIGDWTGVPVDQMNTDELSRITHLPELLGNEIKGQDVALEVIHRHLLTARADLRRPGRPKGAFLLAGPSGVGKTETVVQLAELLYGGKQFLTTINMSEYQEKHTVSRLIGSPPGYVGYGEGGILTEAIRKMPYSIVLLDEVEKAHPEVLNLFYQAFDKGELADGEGRVIDCQNVVFFLTSNLGYQTIVDYAEQPQLLEEMLYPELAAFFKPALLARMEIVPYLPLSGDTLNAIIKGKLSRLVKVFAQRYDAETEIDDALVGEIQRRATRSENGARMLEAIIEGQLLPPVSLALLNKLAAREPVQRVYLTAEDGEFVSEVE
ncbi:type VI secretion system ATPase TssH [Grimontia kaedaensis]|uniref:Type VI secretion system ATPase TssH n=1 Tax=Grimontia kaedaensis TaxID=2872157 RepID=A0ABY4X2A7_9GAMM|nr:type VI secretion system ATPase TssH [Grimontia kaedaensis]USH05384.1 type VI secretion system ATPase TssH [Grimontia kaedaensis]